MSYSAPPACFAEFLNQLDDFTQHVNKILNDKDCGEVVGTEFLGQFGVMQSVVKQHLGLLVRDVGVMKQLCWEG
jgi:hypothetical protein